MDHDGVPIDLTRRNLLKGVATLGCLASLPFSFRAWAAADSRGSRFHGLGTGTSLNVYNPTDFRRKQWVLFGSETPHGQPVVRLPHSYINVGLVDVPPQFDGAVELLPSGSEPFAFHPMLEEDLLRGFQLYMGEKGRGFNFSPLQIMWQHPRVVAGRCYVRTAHGHANLYLYAFHKIPVIHYELVYHCENLTAFQTDPNPLKFGWHGEAQDVLHRCFNGHPDDLLRGQTIDDTQGRRWQGAFFFYNSSITRDPELRDTTLAMHEFPLYAVADWSRWGAFNTPVVPIDRAYVQGLCARQSGYDYTQPFAHFGLIGAIASSQTGDQDGWGAWQNWWTVGGRSAATMFYDQLATAQDHCRPNGYFEANGELVTSMNHPNLVTWDQKPHFSTSVSRDRLGRNNQTGSRSNSWWGYDREHDSATCMANDWILNGSLASLDYLKRKTETSYLAAWTLPSTHPRWSTNSFPMGRAGGRSILAAVYCYRATGNPAIARRLKAMANEMLLNNWAGYNVPGPIKAGRVIGPDPRGGLPSSDSWVPWEDALWVMGAEAGRIMLEENGHRAEADLLKSVIYDIGKSVTLYAWMPNRLQIATAIRWDGTGYPPTDYSDPNQVKPADGTGYKDWALPCLYITKRHAQVADEPAVMARANELIGQLTVGFETRKTLHLGAS